MPGLALLVAMLAVGVGVQGTATDARKIFEEGNAFFEKADNEKALASYDRAIALDGKQSEFHLARCRTLARLQRHGDAITSCTEAISIKPDFAAALLDRGHFLINTRQADRAVPDLLRARTVNADAYGVAYHLALAYYILGDYQKAATEYENCLPNAKTPENGVGCSAWQYVALVRAGRQDDAKAILDRVTLEMKLQSGAAYYELQRIRK